MGSPNRAWSIIRPAVAGPELGLNFDFQQLSSQIEVL